MKKIAILGSTGSIGTQTLEVCDITRNYEVCALSAHSNIVLLEQQIRKYKPRLACVMDEKKAAELKISVADTDTKILSGIDGMCECAAASEAEAVVTAIVGIAGLKPTLSAIDAGKTIALANMQVPKLKFILYFLQLY